MVRKTTKARQSADTGRRDADVPRSAMAKVEAWPEWTEHLRTTFEQEGDEFGLRNLRSLLPHVHPSDYLVTADGTRVRMLTQVDVLNWGQQRRHDRRVLAELRPAIELPAHTDAEKCARWRALAEHVFRFDGQELPLADEESGEQDRTGDNSPLPYSPARQWAEAFRDATHDLRAPARPLGVEHRERLARLERALNEALTAKGANPMKPSLLNIGALKGEVEIAVALIDENASVPAETPPATEEPVRSCERLAELAVTLCSVGREVVEFRRHGNEPAGWLELRKAHLPAEVVAAEAELSDAETEARDARAQAAIARQKPPAAGPTEREQKARTRLEELEPISKEAELKARRGWLASKARKLRAARRPYAELLQPLRLELSGMRPLDGRKVGTFRGESAAVIVLAFADAVLADLARSSRLVALFKGLNRRSCSCRGKVARFDGFDADDVANAARSEFGELLRQRRRELDTNRPTGLYRSPLVASASVAVPPSSPSPQANGPTDDPTRDKGEAKKPTKAQHEKALRLAKLRERMTDPDWKAKPQKQQADDVGVSQRTLRDYLAELDTE